MSGLLEGDGSVSFYIRKLKNGVFVANVNEKVKEEAIKIAKKLREDGVSCQVDLMNRSLTKELEYVNSLGIPYTDIVGSKELKENKVMLRDMKEKIINLKNVCFY
ncbi:MAG: His/Gly/Thr/Pro-type tRNA ligase C-terminal domain-containing protein [Candidatus Aenigmarchaeota archaeon]|nr:His/Gly/Thr/Pro-type tRNA ligase C-terminal domain-containing protein [Candidatus Aenigmarchaeota archaeon]